MNEHPDRPRQAPTAADTWDEAPMDIDTAVELIEKLRERGYEVRPAVQARHPDSAVVKTVETHENAMVTLANIRVDEEYPKEGEE